jgi:hypothetical protein
LESAVLARCRQGKGEERRGEERRGEERRGEEGVLGRTEQG